jgi:membrane protein
MEGEEAAMVSPGALLRRMGRATVLMYESNALGIAKGAAYSGLVALFPVLTAVAALLVTWHASPLLEVLAAYLERVLPPMTRAMVMDRLVQSGEKPAVLLVTAALLALWAAMGFQSSLMEGFDSIYRAPARPFLQRQAISALLVVASTIPMVAASALIVVGNHTEEAVARWLSGLPDSVPVGDWVLVGGSIARLLIAVGSVAAVMGITFYLGPNRQQSWRGVWPGAWLATILWILTTGAFGWYVRNIANYNVMYGSVGAVIALLAWIYILAVIACYGCAFNAARKERHQ